MQIVGPSVANLPDMHRLLQQVHPVHAGESPASKPTRSGCASEVNSRQRFFAHPESMGECSREPGKNSPPDHGGVSQPDQDSNGNAEVIHTKIPLEQKRQLNWQKFMSEVLNV